MSQEPNLQPPVNATITVCQKYSSSGIPIHNVGRSFMDMYSARVCALAAFHSAYSLPSAMMTATIMTNMADRIDQTVVYGTALQTTDTVRLNKSTPPPSVGPTPGAPCPGPGGPGGGAAPAFSRARCLYCVCASTQRRTSSCSRSRSTCAARVGGAEALRDGLLAHPLDTGIQVPLRGCEDGDLLVQRALRLRRLLPVAVDHRVLLGELVPERLPLRIDCLDVVFESCDLQLQSPILSVRRGSSPPGLFLAVAVTVAAAAAAAVVSRLWILLKVGNALTFDISADGLFLLEPDDLLINTVDICRETGYIALKLIAYLAETLVLASQSADLICMLLGFLIKLPDFLFKIHDESLGIGLDPYVVIGL
ncbi:hypothetical protein RRF57_008008 [Xylaria bambusicola]|uniref:Uncharacterized protein n=1 Tax=Xylaria bambusicola TaxID=326684 RepID=A0AAN7UWB0_9PEZI